MRIHSTNPAISLSVYTGTICLCGKIMAKAMKNYLVLWLAIALSLLLITPVMGGTQYMSGSPVLSAYISGSNEVSPGSEIPITVTIKNTGKSVDKLVQSGITDRDYPPTTAKSLVATLSPGNAPVKVKSDPQLIGDLAESSTASATFIIRINEGAPGGTYDIPLELNYSYLASASQTNTETIEYDYKKENSVLTVPITIKSEISLDVISAEPEHIYAGTTGYLDLVLLNTGTASGSQAVVILTRNGDSPVVPVDNSVYIGDFSAGSTVAARYKVSVSDSAEKQSYPVDVAVAYLDSEGDRVTTRSRTIGIPVGGKVTFVIISPPAEMHPGNKKEITVEYKNTGDTPVYGAQSRISAVDPFTSGRDLAYIGNLQPNESRKVSYELSVDRSATIKEYGLDSEIRYRDTLDNTHISDPMKVNIDVTATTGIAIVLTNPIYLSIVIAAIIGIAYFFLHYRRKKQ